MTLPYTLGFKTCSLANKVAMSGEICHPSSTYAGFVQSCNSMMPLAIYDHRLAMGNHVSLYFQPFGEFMANCVTYTPNGEDAKFAAILCAEMCKYYESEDERMEKFGDIFRVFYNFSVTVKLSVTLEGGECDIVIGNNKEAMGEGKVEVGQGSCDSLSKVLSYYIGSLGMRDFLLEKCIMPVCLMELVGTHLFISGAVLGKDAIYLDRLAPVLWLVPQQDADMVVIAKVLGSLKQLLINIRAYYLKCKASKAQIQRFPV